MNNTENDDQAKEQIRTEFIAQRGYWRPWVETLLQSNPGFVRQYARYAGYPARTGPLSERMVELIYVALDSSATHLFPTGLRTHLARALEVGASTADVLDVLHLVVVQGMSSVGQAAAIVAEVVEVAKLAEAGGQTPGAAEPDAGLKARIDQLGAAHALQLTALARWDPGYVAVLLDFISEGRPQEGGLSPAERALVQLSLQACFTAFNPAAVRTLASHALALGVSPAQMLQAVQLGAHLAVHGTALGINTLCAVQDPSPRTDEV